MNEDAAAPVGALDPDPFARAISEIGGQNAFLRQQVGQLRDAVAQLYDAVRVQCVQLQESDRALLQELQRFQTGGPQRAMAAVFHKLFRDLIGHVAELDEFVGSAAPGEAAGWLDAVRVARDRFEQTLAGWGCAPMAVGVGAEAFDPAVHEAVAALPGEVPAGMAENIVVKVRRRGWKLHETILVQPLVVVS